MFKFNQFPRYALRLIGLFGLAVILYLARGDLGQLLDNVDHIQLGTLGLALGCLLCGHVVRAEKMILLLHSLQPKSRWIVYRSLTVGYAFNLILPFRLGELIRAHLMGRQMQISRTAAFMTIVFERLIDAIILPALLLVIWTGVTISAKSWLIIFEILIVGGILLLMVLAMLRANRHFLNAVYHISALFNSRLRDQIRFSIWSGIRFLQVIIKRGNWLAYVILSLLMWSLYIGCVAMTIQAIISTSSLPLAMESFVATITTPGPITSEAYSNEFTILAEPFLTASMNTGYIAAFSWVILILSTSIIGLVLLLFPHARRNPPTLTQVPSELHNLMRHENMPDEMSAFLDSYFGGSAVIHTMNAMETQRLCRNVRILNGGSHAMTLLVVVADESRVRKITRLEHAAKLDAQYNWLQHYEASGIFPKPIDHFFFRDCFIIDIAFLNGMMPFYDYIHHATTDDAEAKIDQILDKMNGTVWQNPVDVHNPDVVHAYIKKKVVTKISDAALACPEIYRLLSCELLIINNKTYNNFNYLVEEIISNELIMSDLAHYAESDVHGDLTVDNILANHDSWCVIDPNNENDIRDMVIDIGKLYQSLHSGYEFLRVLQHHDTNKNIIKYNDQKSYQYEKIFSHLNARMKDELPLHRYRAILFHEAVHYCRMLTYRVSINQDTATVFFAVAVKLFSEFLEQYE